MQTNRQVVKKFFEALGKGELDDELFTEKMTVWTTSSGTSAKSDYQQGVKVLQSLFPKGLIYTINSITTEEDRVAVEARSQGILANGIEFRNSYAFFFRIRDGRIASIAEHTNPMIVNEKIIPLFRAAMIKNPINE